MTDAVQNADARDVHNDDAYHDLEPRQLWRHFAALNRIPRPSGQEDAARQYVQQIADEAGATWKTDAAGNIVVSVEAKDDEARGDEAKSGEVKSGVEDAPIVAIQAHLDMVCEKRPDVQHDFGRDPILPRRDGDRIFASGTTLGADNGIGAAMALALLTDSDVRHGPLELIFTIEEETGLHGAMALDAELIHASSLINLDSEDPLELTIGCAGGADTLLHLPVSLEPSPENWRGCELVVSGLQGGHSGVQIHEPLASAIKLLIEVLMSARKSAPFRLSSIEGGSAHNVIARDAVARLVVAPHDVEKLKTATNQVSETLRSQWQRDEPDMAIQLRETEAPEQVWRLETQENVLDLLARLPHGVVQMSDAFPGKVETSNNLAKVETRADEILIETSSRSFVGDELRELRSEIGALGVEYGAQVEARNGYPGWEPDAASPLLHQAKIAYHAVYDREPQVEVVHAGLECGVIIARKPQMQAISFGPLIRAAHSPDEHVFISTVEPTWKLLTTLLEALK